jgi:hypothetical protein
MNIIDNQYGISRISCPSCISMFRAGPKEERKDMLKEQKSDLYDLRMRPHHIIDIIADHGKNAIYEPNPYGHSLHLIAPKLLAVLELHIMLVLETDDLCTGCSHMLPEGKCDDVLGQLKPSPLKQAYNDVLDCRLLDYLSLDQNCILTTRRYLELVNEKTPGIEKICTHPKEDPEERLAGLIDGLVKLGIRNNVDLKEGCY